MWGAVGTESGRNSRLFRGQLETELGGLALEVGQLPLALLRLVALGADVVIGHPVLEHIVDRPRDLVGGGDEGLQGADLSLFATIERAKGRIRAGHGGSGLPEGLPGAIVGLEGARAEHLAAGNVVVGGQAEPGAEMPGGGEAGHIGADLADDGLGQAGADTLHGDQVDAGDAEELLAGGVGGLVLRFGAGFDGRQRGQVIGRVPARGDGGVLLLDLGVADFDLSGVEVVQFERLAQDEELFLLPTTGQGLDEGLRGGFAGRMTQTGQDKRIALAGDDGAQDQQAGLTGDVREDVVQLEVHLLQCLLQVQDVGGAVLDELGAMTEERAQGAHLGIGAEGGGKQPQGVELLQPLAVLHVRLATGHVLDVAGVDQVALDAARFEQLEDGNPIDAG